MPWFFVFFKEFDVVPHHALVQKLIDNRINLLLLRQISSFLKGCTQQVILNGIKSQPVNVSSGVPQGSFIGSLLFTPFRNNITTCINHCAIRLFADDTLLYTMVHSDTDVTNMQCGLDKLQKWRIENGMKFSALKNNVIAYGGESDNSVPKYYVNGKLLTSMQSLVCVPLP